VATVFDVAAYILAKCGEMTTWKLQKLVYYSQAWSSVWDDKVLFKEPIQAWANGPVCPALYQRHKGSFKISSIPGGRPSRLTPNQKDSIDKIIKFYGKKSAQYLSALTHIEAPWKNARAGLNPGERGSNEITVDAMAEYYGGL
jgi:uncharacterized phage-associated protein